MSIADDLRRDADAALKEAGMYYSGEYLSGIADSVEAIVAENAKLRDAVAVLWECCACNTDSFWCDGCDYHDEDNGGCKVEKVLYELGIEAS